MKPLSLKSEEYREYVYPGNTRLRIENPSQLFITENGSHRVITSAGTTVRPTPGYVGIEWKARSGQPKFVA